MLHIDGEPSKYRYLRNAEGTEALSVEDEKHLDQTIVS